MRKSGAVACRFIRYSLGLGLAAACAAWSARPAQASESIRLNGALPVGGAGADNYAITPDSSRVVYLADQDVATMTELYSVPLSGGTPTKLNSTLVSLGHVFSFQIAPDGSRIVYLADQNTVGVYELFSVPVAGGTPTKLNGTLVTGGSVLDDYRIAPDSSRVVYRATQNTAGVVELFTAPIAGGTAIKLNGTLVSGGDVTSFAIAPDSGRVVYRADQNTDELYELFTVPIAGGTALRLNSALVAGGDVSAFLIAPDAYSVVYVADQYTDELYELFSVPAAGGMAPTKLNSTLVGGGDVTSFQITPDSVRVVYVADPYTDELYELFSAPIAGGMAPIKLNSTLVAGGDVSSFAITPDGSRVVYLADQNTDGVVELYSVPVAGGAATRLNGPLFGNRLVLTFQITPDSSRVVYRADPTDWNRFELFSVPVAGGTPARLSGTVIADEYVDSFLITADSGRVVYLNYDTAANADDLYSVPVAGGTATKLNRSLPAGGGLSNFQAAPDSSRVVYRAAADADEGASLYMARGPERWAAGGGSWDAAANWEFGLTPDRTTDVVLDGAAATTVSGGTTPRVVDTLTLGGGAGSSVLELQAGATVTALDGVTLASNGALRGNGSLDGGSLPLGIAAGAEVNAAEGERLRVISGPVSNAGRIRALGTSADSAELTFDGEVTNLSDTGLIAGGASTLCFNRGLQNQGSLVLGQGVNYVFGDVQNAKPRGSIVVSGGATAIFYDDVDNGGSIQVSAGGETTGLAVFFGALSGNGISGRGTVFLEGDARPGFSPGVMSFGGDVSFGPFAALNIELAGTAPGTQYDRLQVAGELTLGGTLAVTLLSGFTPAAGQEFDVWDAGSASGAFAAVELPALRAGLFWHTDAVNRTGVLAVGVTPESYAAFASYYGLTKPAAGDDDGDGLPNVLEYALGTDPRASNAGAPGSLTVARAGGNDICRFDMPSLSSPDLVLEVHASADLKAWGLLATRTAGGAWTGALPPVLTPAGAGLETVKFTRPNGGAAPQFYRLRVRLAP